MKKVTGLTAVLFILASISAFAESDILLNAGIADNPQFDSACEAKVAAIAEVLKDTDVSAQKVIINVSSDQAPAGCTTSCVSPVMWRECDVKLTSDRGTLKVSTTKIKAKNCDELPASTATPSDALFENVYPSQALFSGPVCVIDSVFFVKN
jgi:hypothetical protein